jgi:hypothetical protein
MLDRVGNYNTTHHKEIKLQTSTLKTLHGTVKTLSGPNTISFIELVSSSPGTKSLGAMK